MRRAGAGGCDWLGRESNARSNFLAFSFIGVGLALPYVVLTFFPSLQRLLPRPGAWMEKFKVAMGFPMLATAAWLLSLVTDHYGRDGVLWVGLFLVLLAVAAWIFGEFIQRGTRAGDWRWSVCWRVSGWATVSGSSASWIGGIRTTLRCKTQRFPVQMASRGSVECRCSCQSAGSRATGVGGFHGELVSDLPGEPRRRASRLIPCGRS